MTAPRLLGLDHVVLRVADLDRARRFYCEVLGAGVERWQEGPGLLQLRAGTAVIDLVPLDGALGREGGAPPGREGRNMHHFCLRIEEFDAAALGAHLAAHGVSPGEVAPRYGAEGRGPSMYIVDPDGNTVELKGPCPSEEQE
jgi:catechol 2,3-dioxygenase-like lactoylglutathione lyase family enzyme